MKEIIDELNERLLVMRTYPSCFSSETKDLSAIMRALVAILEQMQGKEGQE